jgi:hypothetical protein
MTTLENKTQDGNAPETPKNLSAYCGVCKGGRVFVYAFDQPDFLGENEPMYNCSACKNSQAYQTLMQQFSEEVIK